MSISRQNLSIVIVTLKSENVIYQCIKSINKDIPIIVVENSSNSKFKEDLEKKYTNVKNLINLIKDREDISSKEKSVLKSKCKKNDLCFTWVNNDYGKEI